MLPRQCTIYAYFGGNTRSRCGSYTYSKWTGVWWSPCSMFNLTLGGKTFRVSLFGSNNSINENERREQWICSESDPAISLSFSKSSLNSERAFSPTIYNYCTKSNPFFEPFTETIRICLLVSRDSLVIFPGSPGRLSVTTHQVLNTWMNSYVYNACFLLTFTHVEQRETHAISDK